MEGEIVLQKTLKERFTKQKKNCSDGVLEPGNVWDIFGDATYFLLTKEKLNLVHSCDGGNCKMDISFNNDDNDKHIKIFFTATKDIKKNEIISTDFCWILGNKNNMSKLSPCNCEQEDCIGVMEKNYLLMVKIVFILLYYILFINLI